MNRTDRGPLVVLLIASTISQIGNTLTFLAIPWFILATTGSASKTGIAVAVGAVPTIVFGILGGAIVDRLGYRQTSIVADLASGITTLLIPLLYETIGLAYWQLLVLVFLGAILDAPGSTARQSLIPDLIQCAGISLERGNAVWNVARRIAGLLGPPLAGVLIALIGASNLLWIDAATFGVSAGMVAIGIPATHRQAVATTSGGVRQYVSEVAEGFRFLQRERVVLWFFVALSLGSLLAEPLYAVVLPVYAKDVLGSARDLGFILAALAAGSLVGNGVYLAIGPRVSRHITLIGGFVIRALAFWVMVTTPDWWVIAAAIFVSAALFEPINPMSMTVTQERIPPALRGRVYGAHQAIVAGTLPVGVIVYGFLLDAIGMHPTLILFALVNSLLPLAMLAMPSLHHLQRSSAMVTIADAE